MEILRRLARGELAEVLGADLIPTDTLFRSLRIREQATRMAQRQDQQSPAWQALQAYLDGVNQWQASHPKPMEFDLLGIHPRPSPPRTRSASPATWRTVLPLPFAPSLR